MNAHSPIAPARRPPLQIWCLFWALTFGGCLSSSWASGQYKNYIQYTTNEGLPTNELYNGVQTDNGYLLLNSTAGLIRFDGYEFRQYGTKDGLPDVELLGSYKDVRGRVWIRPFANALCYYQNNRIHNRQNDPLVRWLLRQFNTRELFNCFQDEQQTLVLTQESNHFLYMIGRGGSRYHRIPLAPGELIQLAVPLAGSIYVFTTGRIYRFWNGRWSQIAAPERLVDWHRQVAVMNQTLYRLRRPSEATLEVAAFRALGARFERTHTLRLRLPAGQQGRWNLYAAGRTLYLSHGNTLYQTDSSLRALDVVARLPHAVEIGGVIVDRRQNLWLTTLNNGLFLFPVTGRALTSADGLETDAVNRLHAGAAGTVYWSTAHFIYTLDAGRGALKRYRIPVPTGSKQVLRCLAEDERHVYFQYRPNRIWTFDKAQKKMAAYPLPPIGDIKDLNASPAGLFVAHSSGAVLLAADSMRPLTDQRSTSICYDSSQGTAYIGTLTSLLKYDLSTGALVDLSLRQPALRNRITQVRKDARGLLWVAMADAGICILGGDTLLARMNEQAGLLSNAVQALTPLPDGDLLLATDRGVVKTGYRLRGTAFQITHRTNITQEDGLPDNFIHDACCVRGVLYAATQKGIGVLDLNKQRPRAQAPVEITQVTVNGLETEPDSLAALGHGQNYIRIKFSALHFGTGTTTYRYRLLPLQSRWETTTDHLKEFGPLPPGPYRFDVLSVDKNDRAASPITRLAFEIHPAYWQSDWFQALVTCLLLGSAGVGMAALVRSRQRKAMVQKTLAELRIKALRAQMNPHFIFNCMNTIQGFINAGEVLESNRFIAQFAHLIRQTLHFSDQSFISLRQEISYLTNYIQLERTRFDHSFDFAVEAAPAVDLDQVLIPSMLIQPFVENAIRHGLRPRGPGGFLRVAFEAAGTSLTVTVTDNGVGRAAHQPREAAGEYASRGIGITEERIRTYAEITNQTITLDIQDVHSPTGAPAGTRVILKIAA